MARLKVTTRKEIVRGLPTWVTVCSVCGKVNRNWSYKVAQHSRREHASFRRHKPGGSSPWWAF